MAHEDGKSPEAHMAMKARMPGGPRGTITALAVMVQTFLPTPQVHDKHGAKTPEQIAEMQDRENCGVRNLNEVAVNELLPTPRASANENRQTKRTPSQEAGDHGLCLAAEMVELLTETGGGYLPTPAARDWKSGQSNLIGTNARPLNEVVEMGFLPTPLASDGGLDRGSSAGFGLRDVSREIAREALGGPTTPSGSGPEPSDATRQPSGTTSASSGA